MQSRRVTRRTAVAHDENTVTHAISNAKGALNAKGAVLNAKGAAVDQGPVKPALKPRRAAANVEPTRKRSALGDVSNVHKGDSHAPHEEKGAAVKKTTRSALTSKASAVNGVTKPPRAPTATRPLKATAPEKAPAPAEIKKSNSGSGVMSTRKRRTTAAPQAKVKVEKKIIEEQDENAVVEVKKVEVKAVAKPVAPVEAKVTKAVKPAAPEVKKQVKEPESDRGYIIDDAPRPIRGKPLPDDDDIDDPCMVPEYITEIFDYLRKLEPTTQPNPDYMLHQKDLEWDTREILIDWLIEVHTRFSMLPETLFLAVNIIDRFLSVKVVRLDKFQLVGVTALLIASKYEEAVTLHVQHYAKLADNGFSEDEILRAERFILASLDYNLSYPNPMNFLRHISKADDYEIQTRTIAKYLTEISLLDYRFLEFVPSHVAAAAMYLSRMMFERGEWDEHLVYYSDYTEEEVLPVVRMMIEYLAAPVRHRAFYKKYANKRFMKASIHARQWAKRYVAENTELFDNEGHLIEN
ncbi:A/B/D/E cyclin [Ascobolus immersus RN42]|uniref:A/B/D/E cyclin n=1 Tax=Ascobolus immersus RN42 TaxID=1160509 RepID=A0A3N4IHP1_ASCIM|nr:A/B/D/E cyclin [Ascobolus immersus RN42]